jgi:hypothetical protein
VGLKSSWGSLERGIYLIGGLNRKFTVNLSKVIANILSENNLYAIWILGFFFWNCSFWSFHKC